MDSDERRLVWSPNLYFGYYRYCHTESISVLTPNVGLRVKRIVYLPVLNRLGWLDEEFFVILHP